MKLTLLLNSGKVTNQEVLIECLWNCSRKDKKINVYKYVRNKE